MDRLGLNASAEGDATGQTFVLRAAEAVDSVSNAAKSGATSDPYASAGYALCTVVQLGGLIYVLFCLLVAFILLSFLPCANFAFAVVYDFFTAISPARGSARLASGSGADEFRRANEVEELPRSQQQLRKKGRFSRLAEGLRGFSLPIRAFRNPFRISRESYNPVRALRDDLP